MTIVLDAALACLAAVYAWRWHSLRDIAPHVATLGRLSALLSGVAFLWAALASPIAHLDRGHLTGHMIQHLLIMTVAAPLLLLGEPVYVFCRLHRPAGASLAVRSPHPAWCWFMGTFTVLFWHVPVTFEFGMRWHVLQQMTFLVAGLVFWMPVLRPWPTVLRWPLWSIPLYLFLATFPCDALSAFLAFCGRLIYPHYSAMSELCGGVSALEDQARAGTLMWFWVTIAYLVPAAIVTLQILSPSSGAALQRDMRMTNG